MLSALKDVTAPTSDPSGCKVRCALVLTDLVDSTRLFERLGEREATRLLAAEEGIARRLVRQFGGQEIDRSDGFLILFEEAWQAVAFALEYQLALEVLSRQRGRSLQSKVGIHVATVQLFRHSAEDVARGAKPIEVSGLGKPVAARLMSAAQPGQILLSDTARAEAEPECRQRVAELGELEWVAHGAFRLKGVEEPVVLHEVFPRGSARPREPLENDKVVSVRREGRRRLLRMGAAIAAAVGLPAVGYGWYRYTRFEFPRASWLLLADWADRVGDVSLARVLGTAFRIAMEQSRFAYVLNADAIRQTLQRMRVDAESLTDRALVVEVAQREQARAALMPAVEPLEIGLRLSCTLLDPWKNRIVHRVDVATPTADTLTRALDDLAAAVRASLGESIDAIVADSRPLAKVTTSSLDALKLFSEAEYKVRDRKPEEAIALLEQALRIDPDFASAHARMGTVRMLFRLDTRRAEAHWKEAIARSERLTRREEMYVQAALSNTTTPEEMRRRWSAMYTAFPDDMAAGNNVAWITWSHFGQVEEAIRIQQGVVRLVHPWRSRALYSLGSMHLVRGELEPARQRMQESLELDGNPFNWGLLRLDLVEGDVAAAQAQLARFEHDMATPALATERIEAALFVDVYRGDLAGARDRAADLLQRAETWDPDFDTGRLVALRSLLQLGLALDDEAGARAAGERLARLLRAQVDADVGGIMVVPRTDVHVLAIAALRQGWSELLDALQPMLALEGRWSDYPQLRALRHLLRGWQALGAGELGEALAEVERSRRELPLFLASELELEARRRAGEEIGAAAAALAGQLHRALGEPYNYFSLLLPNLLFWRRLRSWI